MSSEKNLKEETTVEMVQRLYDEGYSQKEIDATIRTIKRLNGQDTNSWTRVEALPGRYRVRRDDSYYAPINRQIIINSGKNKGSSNE